MARFRLLSSSRPVAFVLSIALLIWLEVFITHTTAFSQHQAGLSLAVLFDLVFVTTALFYWLIARPFQLAISRTWLVALLMLRIALFILPETSLLPSRLWPLLLIFVEGAALVIAALRLRIIVRTYQQMCLQADTETAFLGSLAAVFGERAAGVITGEGLIVYYTLLGWRLRPDVPIGANSLTTHRQSGQIALTVGLLLVGLVEGVGVHLLVTRWNPTVAFWVTALSGYGLLFFVADMVATVKRPSYLTDDQLHIRMGVRWRATINRSRIASILLIHEKPAKQPGQFNGAFLTAPNVLLTFHQPVTFQGPYGLQKAVQTFSFFADDRSELVQQLSKSTISS